MNEKSYSVGQTFAFSAIIVFMFFFLLEAGLRIYVHVKADAEEGKFLPPVEHRQKYQTEDPVLGVALVPGYDTPQLHINRLGFRGPEIQIEKPPGVIRVVSLGDSTTFGLYGKQCPYPAHLQAILNSHQKGTSRYEVINGGVEGVSSHYALSMIKERVSKLAADVVLIYIGWNDLYRTNPLQPDSSSFSNSVKQAESMQELDSSLAKISKVLDHIYIAQFLRRLIYFELPRLQDRVLQSQNNREQHLSPLFTYNYKRKIGLLVDGILGIRAKPILMTMPTIVSQQMSAEARSLVHFPTWANGDEKILLSAIEAYNDAIREIAAERNVGLIDAAEYFDSMGSAKEAYFFDTMHMYCEGNGILADYISGFLEGK